jgi:D-alanine-D-alanine ligase
LLDALELAFEFTRTVLVEPAITSLREINCAVLGDYEKAEASECEEPLNAEDILTFEGQVHERRQGRRQDGGAKTADAKAAGGGSKSGMASLQRRLPADLTPKNSAARSPEDGGRHIPGARLQRRFPHRFHDRQGDTDKLYVNEINTIPGSHVILSVGTAGDQLSAAAGPR